MPTVTVPPSRRTHSWSLVNRVCGHPGAPTWRSAWGRRGGRRLAPGAGLPRTSRPIGGAGGGEVAADVAHGDRRAERGREAAGGDAAGGGAVRRRGPGSARGPGRAPSGRMPTRSRVGPCWSWSRIGAAPGKPPSCAAALADGPGEVGLDRGGQLVDVVAVEAEPGLEPEAVARAEPGGLHVRVAEQRLRPAPRRFARGRRSRTRPRRCSRSG